MKELYIIRCGDSDLFKIGISKCPEKRLKQLQTGNPHILKILFTFKVSEKYKNIEAQKIEHTIHQFLKENKNLHIINEWFKLTNDMVVQIAKCLIDNFT